MSGPPWPCCGAVVNASATCSGIAKKGEWPLLKIKHRHSRFTIFWTASRHADGGIRFKRMIHEVSEPLRKCGPTKPSSIQTYTSWGFALHVNLKCAPQVEPDPSPPPPLKDHPRRRFSLLHLSPLPYHGAFTYLTSTHMPSPYEKEFKPPRPRNAWIIFRTDQLKLRQPAPGARPQLQAHASKDIAKIWKNLSPEVRAEYERRAAEEKAEHERRYPNYKYKPRSKADKEREREEKKAEKLRKKEEAKRARLQLPQATYAYGPQLSYYAAAAAMVSAPEDLPSPPLSLASPLPDASTPSSVGSSMIRQASSSGSSRNVSQSNSPASSSRHTLDNDESIAPRAVAYLERKKASKVASGRENGPGSLHEELSWMLNQFPLQSQDTIQPYAAASSASAAIAPPPLTNLEQQAMLSTVPQMQSEFSYEHNWIIPRSDASQLQVFLSFDFSWLILTCMTGLGVRLGCSTPDNPVAQPTNAGRSPSCSPPWNRYSWCL